MDSKNPGHVVRKEPGEKQRNSKLMGVGFPSGLEPESSIICRQAEEAEGGAGVQLSKLARWSEAQRTDLFFNPLEKFLQPAGPGERPRFLAPRVGVEFLESLPDRRSLSRINPVCGRGRRHPAVSVRRFVAMPGRLHHGALCPVPISVGSRKVWNEKTIGFESPFPIEFRHQLFCLPLSRSYGKTRKRPSRAAF